MYKLILVDDEPMIAEQFALAYDWEELGFELVKTFTSGSKAMEYIKSNPVDALISDVKMPGVTGIELAKYCYESYPNIGLVLLSAYRDFEFAHKAIRYNVIGYILKPINDDEFAETMFKLKEHLSKQQEILKRPSEFSKNMIINEAVSYIKQHFGENITSEAVARHVLMNPEYFGVYFKKHFGKNFIDFLKDVRMEETLKLLEDDKLKIYTIAEMVGYKSATHFYEVFQAYYNQTPSQYRKNLKKNKI